MTKLDDTVIKTKDRALSELLNDLITFWNKGKIGFTKITADPTDTPSDVELRILDSGAGAVRIYVFVPGSAQSGIGWWKSANLTEVT